MEEFLGYTQVTWQALGVKITALTFGAGAIAALSAARQVRLNRQNKELETRPYVIVDLASSPADENLKDFVVKNIGVTPAYNVSVSFDQVPHRVSEISGYSLPETPMFKSGIAMLAPERRVSVFFDSVSDRLGQKELPSKYEVTLTYKGLPRKKWFRTQKRFQSFTDTYTIDMLATASTPNVDVHSMHDLVKTVQRLTDAFTQSSLAKGSIDVVTESREDRENRIEEERRQRQEDRKRLQLQHLKYIADTKGRGSEQYARLAANARMLGIEVPEMEEEKPEQQDYTDDTSAE